MKIDKKSIMLIKQGDRKTIEYIYSSYYKLVKYKIYEIVRNNEDAEELTQDVFVKVFDRIEQYDVKNSFATWLINIAKNAGIDHLRKRRVDIEYTDDVSSFNDGEENPFSDDLDKKIKELLTEEEYIIVTGRIYFELKFIDIAGMLNANVPSVTSRYYKVISKLKKGLKKEDKWK